jgi:HSP20 family protein
VISGERPRPTGEGRVYEQVEIEYGSFSRQIRLPADVDSDGASARYDLGVITVSLPVAEQVPAAGRISIAVGAA